MDNGSSYTDRRVKMLELRLQRVYRGVQKDLEQGFDRFLKRHRKKGEEMLKKLADGEITQKQYAEWMRAQVAAGKEWQRQIDDATDRLKTANEKALRIVRDEQLNVFTENANMEAYQIEKDYKGTVRFDIYDEQTVERLVDEKPELMPRKVLDGRKDKAWNQGVISNAMATSIVRGESIPEVARRLAHDTANTDMTAMVRYARTAMTAAQNAGRLETMHQAEGLGIDVKKQWMATLDGRTRDSHRYLDGQIRDVDKPFDSELGEIMYPGDPTAHPGDVWNCRCTMVYVYPKYPDIDAKRRDNETDELIEDMTYKEWETEKQREKEIQDKAIDDAAQRNGFSQSEVDKGISLELFRRRQTHQKISETGKKIIPKPLYNKLLEPVKRAGGTIRRGDEETVRHLDKMGAHASTIGDVLLFRDDATISDVLEERCHFYQNKNHINDDKPHDERTCLNEIAAKEYLIAVAKKYKIPPEETAETMRELAAYKKELKRLRERHESD